MRLPSRSAFAAGADSATAATATTVARAKRDPSRAANVPPPQMFPLNGAAVLSLLSGTAVAITPAGYLDPSIEGSSLLGARQAAGVECRSSLSGNCGPIRSG